MNFKAQFEEDSIVNEVNQSSFSLETTTNSSSPEGGPSFEGKWNKQGKSKSINPTFINEESPHNFHHDNTRRQCALVRSITKSVITSYSSETESSILASNKISFSSRCSSDDNIFMKEKTHNNSHFNEQIGNSNKYLECKTTENEKKKSNANTCGSSSQEESGTSSFRGERQSHCVSRSDDFSVKNEGTGSSSEEGVALVSIELTSNAFGENNRKASEECCDGLKRRRIEEQDDAASFLSSGSDTLHSNRTGCVSESETGYAASASSNEDSIDQQEYNESPSLSSNDYDEKRSNKMNRHSFTRRNNREDSIDLSDSTEISSSEEGSYDSAGRSSSPQSYTPDGFPFDKTVNSVKPVSSSIYAHVLSKNHRTQNYYHNKHHSHYSARHNRTYKTSSSSNHKQSPTRYYNSNNARTMIRSSRVIFERSMKKNHQYQQKNHGRKRSHQEMFVPQIYNSKLHSTIRKRKSVDDYHNSTPIYYIGYDIMAHVLSYLDPPAVNDFLAMPLSKSWQSIYTSPKDLWKILCSTSPFNANLNEAQNYLSESDCSSSFSMVSSQSELRHLFGKHRLLYTSFVRCVIYLQKLKDDVKKGVPAASLGKDAPLPPGLKYLNKSNTKRRKTKSTRATVKCDDLSNYSSSELLSAMSDCSGSDVEQNKKEKKMKKLLISKSQLTDRLFGPCVDGSTGQLDLPISCAIYSVVNWMIAFSDVQGIQILCLKVIPLLLEDENQRITAQKAGLTDIVLQEMVLFPDNVHLHTAAFHAIVLLARPLGGREGMLFHSAMINSSSIFSVRNMNGRNGIAVMLDSMRRFNYHELLQAMGCWSMVNIALIPGQKTMLMKLGGITVALNAMITHPHSAEVQFRAAFALINLVIPSEPLMVDSEVDAIQEHLGSVNEVTEHELLDENVAQIVNLVVVAMKTFCTSEAIMNRCCLVLHNICNVDDYHTTLLWTPNCYQMLEWALANYRNDLVLQQSAQSTLQRLQLTLSNDIELRTRFAASIRAHSH